MPSRPSIRIDGLRGAPAEEIVAFLSDLNSAYSHLWAFELTVSDLEPVSERRWLERAKKPPTLRPIKDVLRIVYPEEKLVLTKAAIESPGFWEFLGSLNPLREIREFLNDRHRRRQDREYRERAEARRLELENVEIETRIIERWITILRRAGYAEQDIRRFVTIHVHDPLNSLVRHVDAGLIGGASIEEHQ